MAREFGIMQAIRMVPFFLAKSRDTGWRLVVAGDREARGQIEIATGFTSLLRSHLFIYLTFLEAPRVDQEG